MLVKAHTRSTARRPAFTLMEMLVVVAIIVVLAGLGGYYLLGQLSSARDSAAKAQMQVLTKAVKTYMIDHNGMPPGSLQELLGVSALGKGPYLENAEAIYDPWGNPYGYDPSGTASGQQMLYPAIYCTNPQGVTLGNWTSR